MLAPEAAYHCLRDFFSFALTGLSGETVSAATLSVSAFESVSDSGCTSQQYTLYGVSMPATVLDNPNGTSAAIYAALGSGTVFGSYSVPDTGFGFGSDTFALNAAGVAAVNAVSPAGW